MSEDKKASLDLGALLDSTLDNIEEAPDFALPPPGEVRIRCEEIKTEKYTPKPKDGKVLPETQRLRFNYSLVHTYSVSNDEQPIPDGSLFSETYQGTEEGLSYAKKRIREILNVESVDGVTLRVMMDECKGKEFDARTSYRLTPNPADKDNPFKNLNMKVIQRVDSSDTGNAAS